MGKRELMLIAAFVILGGIVYQLTATPAPPGEEGFSISKILDEVRREVRGSRFSAERTSTVVQAIDAAVTEVRVTLRNGPLTIVGEPRDDVSAELKATSNGVDDAEAQRLVEATNIKFDKAGSILFVSVDFPEPGQQRVRNLALAVPSRLIVRVIESHQGKLEISGVAGVELGMARGETIVQNISGRVTASHRGGDFRVSDAGSVELTTRGSDVTVERIRGEATFETQAGDLKTTGIAGAIELESNATDVLLEALERTAGAVHVNASGGDVEMRGLRTESRIDLRNAGLDLVVDRPATIAIYSEGDEPVNVTVPRAGFRLDALATGAAVRTTPDDLAVKWGVDVTRAEPDGEQKVSGDVHGGGPLLTIRTRQASITLLAADTTAPATTRDSKPRP